MAASSSATFLTPIGEVRVLLQQGEVSELTLGRFAPGARQIRPAAAPADDMLPVLAQLQAYFEDGRQGFSLPVKLLGTDFQRRVWQALQAIPAGEVRTYGQLAEQLGSHSRAIGMACRNNPVPLIVPCHRVVAADGPGGFAGQRGGEKLALKRWLLAHEGVRI